jgi:hypothetical protein
MIVFPVFGCMSPTFSSVADAMPAPSSSYQTGTRWPHQSWRLMHQSRTFSSQSR